MPIIPVEYMILEFPGDGFHDEIVPTLARLIESKIIRMVDLVFIKKDPKGHVTTYEFDQVEELAGFATLPGEVGGLVKQEDIEYAASALHPDTSAAVLVWEDMWAAELAGAIRAAGGVVVEGALIAPELVEAARAESAIPSSNEEESRHAPS